MMKKTNQEELKLIAFGHAYRLSPDTLDEWRHRCDLAQIPILQDLADFLHQWWADTPQMCLQSSGSTGAPKQFWVDKQFMRASAEMTCRYFSLGEQSRVILALPLTYIAAKMMIVRALLSGLELWLVPPSSHPLEGLPDVCFDFAPLVPLQAAVSRVEDMARLRTILLGGGHVPAEVEIKLKAHEGAVFASYGMTESLSHIALRPINGAQASLYYQALNGVSIDQNEQGCLCFSAPHLGIEWMETHDVIEFNEQGQFKVIGRCDNVINSGGIKIHAEELEQRIEQLVPVKVAALAYPHEQLGQALALLWEGHEQYQALLEKVIQHDLPPYYKPKRLAHVAHLPRTISGKIARSRCYQLFEEGDSH